MTEIYNGYSNKPTYLVALWIQNNPELYDLWTNKAKTLEGDSLIKELKAYFEDQAYPLTGATVYSDLLNYSLGRVNWEEIAETIKE